MRSRIDEFAARSAKVVFVGPGTGAMAAEFQAAHAKDHVVLGDPKRVTFGLLSMRRSVGAALHWRFARNLWRAWRGGFRQQGLRGDPWQQGGVCVFEPDGQLRYVQCDGAAGDRLDMDALVAAVGAHES